MHCGRCFDVLDRDPHTRKACNGRAVDCKFTVGILTMTGMQRGEENLCSLWT